MHPALLKLACCCGGEVSPCQRCQVLPQTLTVSLSLTVPAGVDALEDLSGGLGSDFQPYNLSQITPSGTFDLPNLAGQGFPCLWSASFPCGRAFSQGGTEEYPNVIMTITVERTATGWEIYAGGAANGGTSPEINFVIFGETYKNGDETTPASVVVDAPAGECCNPFTVSNGQVAADIAYGRFGDFYATGIYGGPLWAIVADGSATITPNCPSNP